MIVNLRGHRAASVHKAQDPKFLHTWTVDSESRGLRGASASFESPHRRFNLPVTWLARGIRAPIHLNTNDHVGEPISLLGHVLEHTQEAKETSTPTLR